MMSSKRTHFCRSKILAFVLSSFKVSPYMLIEFWKVHAYICMNRFHICLQVLSLYVCLCRVSPLSVGVNIHLFHVVLFYSSLKKSKHYLYKKFRFIYLRILSSRVWGKISYLCLHLFAAYSRDLDPKVDNLIEKSQFVLFA